MIYPTSPSSNHDYVGSRATLHMQRSSFCVGYRLTVQKHVHGVSGLSSGYMVHLGHSLLNS